MLCEPYFCNYPDYETLLEFYELLDGKSWLDNKGWKDGYEQRNCNPCNEWYGVTCENNRVTSITLVANRLRGDIPKIIKKLDRLKILRLEGNDITGDIPLEILEIKELRRLSLHLNRLTGTIPAEFSLLQNLEWLELQNNHLTGEIPAALGELSNLQLLFLHDNELTGEIPAVLGDLRNLSVFLLNNNKLNGCIPDNLLNLCPNLYAPWVDISGNPDLSNQNWFTFCDSQEGMCTSSIKDFPIDYDIGIYPNPATDFLYIQSSKPHMPQKMDIFDYSGKLISSEYLQEVLDVSNLTPGFYILNIYYEDGMISKKFIKQ